MKFFLSKFIDKEYQLLFKNTFIKQSFFERLKIEQFYKILVTV